MLNKLPVSPQRTVNFDLVYHGRFIYTVGEEVSVLDEILPREAARIKKDLNSLVRVKIGHDHRKESLVVT